MREGVSPTRGAKIVDLRPVPATYQTSRAKKRKPPPGPSIKLAPRQGKFRFPLEKGFIFPLDLLLFFFETNNLIGCTVQNLAKPFQGMHGNALAVFKIIDGSWIDAVLVDERISADALLIHGFP